MQIGDKVFLKPTGNAVRYYQDDILKGIKEAEISKIGNKYFYLKEWDRNKFDIQKMCSTDNCNSGYCVYLSMQEIYDEQEFLQLSRDIRKVFDQYGKLNLSLTQLRKIKLIIDEK